MHYYLCTLGVFLLREMYVSVGHTLLTRRKVVTYVADHEEVVGLVPRLHGLHNRKLIL